MNCLLRNTSIVIAPFLIMIVVNEVSRKKVNDNLYVKNNIVAINSTSPFTNKCSWACHNNTSYCIQHHVKSPGFFVKKIKPIYFGIISVLNSTGNYGLANILFLVILWPILMFVLLIKTLSNTKKLNQSK